MPGGSRLSTSLCKCTDFQEYYGLVSQCLQVAAVKYLPPETGLQTLSRVHLPKTPRDREKVLWVSPGLCWTWDQDPSLGTKSFSVPQGICHWPESTFHFSVDLFQVIQKKKRQKRCHERYEDWNSFSPLCTPGVLVTGNTLYHSGPSIPKMI